jgi:hypothetical protein
MYIKSYENDILFSNDEKLYNQLISQDFNLQSIFTLELIYYIGNKQYILLKNNINSFIYGKLSNCRMDIKDRGSKIKIIDYHFNNIIKCYYIKIKKL